MKKLISICLFSFIAFSSFSQHSQVTLSDDFKVKEKWYRDQTVAHSVYSNNFFYTATNSGTGNYKWLFTKLYDMVYSVTITMFDKNMNKLKELELANGEKLYGPLAPQLILLNDKLCLVYFQSDNKTSFNVYLSLIDETTLALKEPKKICTIEQPNVGISSIESVFTAGLVLISNSPDKMKTLVACNASPNVLKSFVIDNNLNILKQSTLKTTTAGFTISTAVLTNDNLECYILKSEEETRVVCNSADGKKNESRFNPSAEGLPSNCSATISKDGKSIYIYSTTIKEKDAINCNGLLISQVDCSTMKLSKPLVYEFDGDFLEKIYEMGGGERRRKEFFIHNFTPDLIELENGTLAIMGCPELITNSTYISTNMQNQQQQKFTTTLDMGPVIAFYPNKNGKSLEYVIVPRRVFLATAAKGGTNAIKLVQSRRVTRLYSGFAASSLGDEIVIIYNDNEKNLARGVNEKIKESDSPKDLVLAEAVISKDKRLQHRMQIEKNMSGSYTYFLGNAIPTSSSMIIFPIGKQGQFSTKTTYTNWCFLGMK